MLCSWRVAVGTTEELTMFGHVESAHKLHRIPQFIHAVLYITSMGIEHTEMVVGKPTMGMSTKAVEDVRPRTGTVFTGFCQIVTAVVRCGVLLLTWGYRRFRFVEQVGAGILALPNAMAALGWVAGIILLLIFAIITYCCSLLLVDCCEHDGVRQPSYYYVVKAAFPTKRWPCCMIQVVQMTNLTLTGERQ